MKKIAWILVIIGALNWGLVGLGALLTGSQWNLVQMIFGSGFLAHIIYLLVGISAFVCCMGCKKRGGCRACLKGECNVHNKRPESGNMQM